MIIKNVQWQTGCMKGLLSPRVIPNGTQAVVILCMFVDFYDCMGTIEENTE